MRVRLSQVATQLATQAIDLLSPSVRDVDVASDFSQISNLSLKSDVRPRSLTGQPLELPVEGFWKCPSSGRILEMRCKVVPALLVLTQLSEHMIRVQFPVSEARNAVGLLHA